MLDLSLYILDLYENAKAAKAKNVEISIVDTLDIYEITLKDDGIGMSPAMQNMVKNPFMTTKKNSQVGLGVSFFDEMCVRTGGEVLICSVPNKGTKIEGFIYKKHLDCPKLGNIVETIYLLFLLYETEIVFKFNNFIVTTNEIYEILNNVSLTDNIIKNCFLSYIERNIQNEIKNNHLEEI